MWQLQSSDGSVNPLFTLLPGTIAFSHLATLNRVKLMKMFPGHYCCPLPFGEQLNKYKLWTIKWMISTLLLRATLQHNMSDTAFGQQQQNLYNYTVRVSSHGSWWVVLVAVVGSGSCLRVLTSFRFPCHTLIFSCSCCPSSLSSSPSPYRVFHSYDSLLAFPFVQCLRVLEIG